MRTVLLLLATAALSTAHPQYPAKSAAYQEDPYKGNHPPTQPQGGGYSSPQQSGLCGTGSGCVPWPACINGVIDTSGAGQLNLRAGPGKAPEELGYTNCGAVGNVCCGIPGERYTDGATSGPYPSCSAGLLCVNEIECNLYTGFIGARIPLYEGQPFIEYNHCTSGSLAKGVCCQADPSRTDGGGGDEKHTGDTVVTYTGCSPYEECVPPIHCNRGTINTDGEGLIDLRKKPDYRVCIDAEYGDSGVCCRVPDAPPVPNHCPQDAICTDLGYCNAKGHIVPNVISGSGYTSGSDCYTTPGLTLNVGVCCKPDPVQYGCSGSAICTDRSYCNANGLVSPGSLTGAGYISGTECYTNPGVDHNIGVCCNPAPVLPLCPEHSPCTDLSYCTVTGFIVPTAVTGSGYASGSECYTNPHADLEVGVCCQTAPVLPPCPDYSACTGVGYCNTRGFIVPNTVSDGGYSSGSECYTNPGVTHDVGVCCNPAPVLPPCPEYSTCTDLGFCSSQGFIVTNPVTGSGYSSGSECYTNPHAHLVVGVCCQTAPVYSPCPDYSICTDVGYCNAKGFIVPNVLSGAGYSSGSECYTNPGVTHDVGVCCNPAPVLPPCPEYSTCTGRGYCSAQGFIVANAVTGAGYSLGAECYINPGSTESVGVCCNTAPDLKLCSEYSLCTDRGYCNANGYIELNPITGTGYITGPECYINEATHNVGVCCNTKIQTVYDTCPGDSLCIPEDFCFGKVLDNNQNLVNYAPGGSWSQCSLPGLDYTGVCCSNPRPDLPVPTGQCGVSHYGTKDDKIKNRIHVPQLDKLEADFGELPWQAIVFFSNYTFKCGASVISDKYLLTVAHCVKELYPQDIRIRVGEWQVNTFSEPLPYQDLDVASITVNPLYNPRTHTNNIAILELKTPIKLEYNVNSICLPVGTVSFPPGTRCLVSGWGKDSFEGSYQHILKKIDVPLVDHHTCQSLLRKTRLGRWFRLHDSYMCAGGEAGKDACVGDGGGPLICFDQTAQKYVQVGMTAWGIGCGVENVPAAYTDLSKFTTWIGEVTGIGVTGGTGYGK